MQMEILSTVFKNISLKDRLQGVMIFAQLSL